jgi:multisubunit Na+/H+ antiporter MnhB subunit
VERQSEKSPVGPLRASALALLILGFLVLVTLAASGARRTGHAHLAERQVPNTLQDSWVTLMTITYVVVIVAVLVTVFRRRDRWEDPRSRWLQNFLVILVVMALFTGAGFWAVRHGHFRRQSQAQQTQQGRQGRSQGGNPAALKPLPARHAQFQWPLALALGGLVLLGGVWLLVRRGRTPEFAEEVSVEDELARAIGSTIDDLQNEQDARRAVIAAYASMEGILASHGLARRGAETPYEYLARVLHMLDVRESAARSLTELFEYAKFSDHEIDSAMKDRAIESLVAVKEDLQARKELAA